MQGSAKSYNHAVERFNNVMTDYVRDKLIMKENMAQMQQQERVLEKSGPTFNSNNGYRK